MQAAQLVLNLRAQGNKYKQVEEGCVARPARAQNPREPSQQPKVPNTMLLFFFKKNKFNMQPEYYFR
jgi:hypothetical protein